MSDRVFDVVVVDDDFLVASVHRRFVESLDGYQVVATAMTGADALEQVRGHRPDLVLLDVHLPDMSGIEVLRRLRQEGHEVGVLIVTASREVDQVRAAHLGGAAGYLVKPFSQADLAARLADFRETQRRLAEAGPAQADQVEIDALFGGAPRVTAAEVSALPKGLNLDTGELVLAAVREAGEVSATECAEAVGLSRVTARRYLEYYVETGVLYGRQQYGRVGRPERRYSL